MRNTFKNETSSRSHLLISLVLEWKKKGSQRVIGKMTFIDLAGSERLAEVAFNEDLFTEALFIDESLQYLSFLVRQLGGSVHDLDYIYTGSILTTLLKDTIGGNAHTLVIVNISPSNVDIVATFDSLNFAVKTGLIKN